MHNKRLKVCSLSFIIISISTYCIYQESIKNNTITITTSEEAYQIKEVLYEAEGVKGYYPQVISGTTKEKMAVWNEIIKDDFNKIVNTYSFAPYSDLQGTFPGAKTSMLEIDYNVTLLNNQFMSIFYTAVFQNPYSPYPTELVYTTNIDTKKDTRLRLEDFILLDLNFARTLKDWEYTTTGPSEKEWEPIIKDILSNMENEFLLKGLKAADQIASDNILGIYSYLTAEKLGISIAVPNFVGDHAELEKKYIDIKNYLNPIYEWNFDKKVILPTL
ncbi:hypothetical protein I5677_01820 [Mobilitalea sibirica]|uniref:Uncharacterized protein n=1 Tax=Mobilitalea sibirica TaxID=1462919 RepID=A0A8J7H0H6_9FIRM|nr:hypothetical protein [Mobilitalea sibirica]MBH1939629.1 hypothetical protein [Mobilitalea sibirica]